MDIKDKIIDAFEDRIMQLITITDLRQLPQWDDADVLGTGCLLKEYRRITSAMHSDGEGRCLRCNTICRIKNGTVCQKCGGIVRSSNIETNQGD